MSEKSPGKPIGVLKINTTGEVLDFKPSRGYIPVVPPNQVIGNNLTEVYPNDLVNAVVNLSLYGGPVAVAFAMGDKTHHVRLDLQPADLPDTYFLIAQTL